MVVVVVAQWVGRSAGTAAMGELDGGRRGRAAW